MNDIKFCTSVSYDNNARSIIEKLTEAFDDYFYTSGEKAHVMPEGEFLGRKVVQIRPHNLTKSERCLLILKIISYLTGIIPLLMLIGKAILRNRTLYATLIPLFPNPRQIPNHSFATLHQRWKINNEILIGIIAQKQIPKFGFHGTHAHGLAGLLKERESKGSCGFWIAGIEYQLDPITYLADIYTAATLAATYERQNGGIFTIVTKDAYKHKQITDGSPIVNRAEDSEADKKFLGLLGRNNVDDKTTYDVTQEIVDKESNTISSKCLFPAAELKLNIAPQNYDERVKGVLEDNRRIYSRAARLEWGTNHVPYRDYLERFAVQELIFNAFENLKVINPDLLRNEWKAYHNVGAELMRRINTVTRVSMKQLKLLDASAYTDLVFNRHRN